MDLDQIPNRKLAERAIDNPIVEDATRGLDREDAILHIATCYNTVGKMLMSFDRENPEERTNGEIACSPLEACITAVMMVANGTIRLDYEGDRLVPVIVQESDVA